MAALCAMITTKQEAATGSSCSVSLQLGEGQTERRQAARDGTYRRHPERAPDPSTTGGNRAHDEHESDRNSGRDPPPGKDRRHHERRKYQVGSAEARNSARDLPHLQDCVTRR